jgi:hypothetical protein
MTERQWFSLVVSLSNHEPGRSPSDKYILSERSSFDRLRMSGVEGLRTSVC